MIINEPNPDYKEASDEYLLTWTFLWSLFRLRWLNPNRADGFKLKIIDYNMRANYPHGGDNGKAQEG